MSGALCGSTLFLFRLPLQQEGKETQRFEGAAACCSLRAQNRSCTYDLKASNDFNKYKKSLIYDKVN